MHPLATQPQPSPFTLLTFAEMLGLDLPPRGLLLTPWLPEKGLALIHGPRGIGKTHLALGIAHAVATGGSFLRWHAPEPRRVVLLDGEMPAAVLRDRCAALAALPTPTATPLAGLAAKNLRFLAMDLQRTDLDLADPEDQAILEPYLDGADLIIVDNISTLTRLGRENDADSWLPVQIWALTQRRAGRTVLFVHHSAKNGRQRGTSRREDVLDTVLALRHPSETDTFDGTCFEVHVEKNRGFHGPAARPFEATLHPTGWQTRPLIDPAFPLVVALTELGHSVRQIAEQMEISKSTVHRLQRRARAQGLLNDDFVSKFVPL